MHVTSTQRCQNSEAEMNRWLLLLMWEWSCYSCVKIVAIAMAGIKGGQGVFETQLYLRLNT